MATDAEAGVVTGVEACDARADVVNPVGGFGEGDADGEFIGWVEGCQATFEGDGLCWPVGVGRGGHAYRIQQGGCGASGAAGQAVGT